MAKQSERKNLTTVNWEPIMADLEVLRTMRGAREAGDTTRSQRIAEEIVAKMARENVGLAFGR
jgi:hypothetical protein